MRSSVLRSRVDEGLAQLARDAQQLVPVLVADADGHGHRDDAAQHRAPECIDELLVVVQQQDHPVAGLGAQLLQVVQDAQRALVQFAVA